MPQVRGRHGNRIHYERHGDEGPAVVLLQGLALAGAFWFDVPARLARQASRPQRVFVIDNRGVGQSSRPRRPFAMWDMADDTARVLDAEGVDRAVVVGVSMGGMIAQHFALRHPERTEGLVLMSTTAGGLNLVLPSPQVLTALLGVPLGRGDRRRLARLVLPESQVDRVGEHLRGWGRTFKDNPIRPSSFFAQLGAVSTHRTGRALKGIQCPTAVVTGDDDALVPAENARKLAKLIPGAHLEVLPDVGHYPTLLDPHVVERNVARVRGW